MTLLYTDVLFLQHDTGHHPETADRLRAITARLEKTGLVQACRLGKYTPLTKEAIRRLHSPGMVEAAQQVASQGGGYLDADTVVSAQSYAVALAAAGACVAAADAVLATGAPRLA